MIPWKEEIYARSKKAMYYSISGHAFALLGCVDEAREAFTRAKRLGCEYATCEANLAQLEKYDA